MSLFTVDHKPMTLRPYQAEAVEAVYRHLRERDDNPCVVIPTGGGKTPVIATICSDAVSRWNGRVLILAHVKELLEQAADKLDQVCPDIHVGVYSAGLKRRDTTHPVIIAGIQSVYQKAEQLGHFDLVVVDEAHMIPPGKDGDGMYRRLLADMHQINPRLRVIGLTATPFRMSSGPICVPPPDGILNAICYEIGVRELIRDGYLSPTSNRCTCVAANSSRTRSNNSWTRTCWSSRRAARSSMPYATTAARRAWSSPRAWSTPSMSPVSSSRSQAANAASLTGRRRRSTGTSSSTASATAVWPIWST